MALEMTVERLDAETAVGTITGPLTMGTNLKTIDSNLQTLVAEGVTRLVLDLTECPYSDSAGLGVLMQTFGLLREKDGQLRLCGVGERIGRMLRLTTTDKFFRCDATRAESVAALDAA